jgi:multidrug efflux pump subunit AcrB
MALPGAFTGIIWALFLTQTSFNVPSLMGAIMTIGVATANSILLVTFANEQWRAGMNSLESALQAGATRLRPVLMTAGAMVIGMFPMALGLGEGGEQNAPLGRAVIGGLVVATLATLFFVPVVFSLLRSKGVAGKRTRGRNPQRRASSPRLRHDVSDSAFDFASTTE